MNKVADYDTLDYDYRTYWKKRKYEHLSEMRVLKKLLKRNQGKWFLDVGGSYGRVISSYYDKYEKPLIVDYSLKTLQRNYQKIKDKYPNVELIAANAYYLPFKSNTFDGSLMIRVLHHIERPEKYIKEIYRVISPGGIYIQEFANKHHIKAVIKGLTKLDFSFLDKTPYQQPKMDNNEGARKDAYVPFLNFHISFIKDLLLNNGFKIKKIYGCSYLRLNILKRILNIKLLLLLENIFQNLFSWLNISPSIFVKSNKQGILKDNFEKLEDILVCPRCKNTLKIQNSRAICIECKETYRKKSNIWDFRI